MKTPNLFSFAGWMILALSGFTPWALGEIPLVAPSTPVAVESFSKPIRVACVGDSITQGVGASRGNSYPSQLGKFLGPKWEVGNFGVSGTTMLKQGDNPYFKQGAFTNAQKFNPDVVIIMLGTNDTKGQNWKHKEEYAADCRWMVEQFQKLDSKPRVFLCRPCPVVANGNFGINEAGVLELIGTIDPLAATLKVSVIDMHLPLAAHPEFIPDRVHPNNDGAGAMAKAAYQALTGKVWEVAPPAAPVSGVN